ncbi:MAG TPA: hydroxyacylglutathione hydrolase [Deltaproteobacteria bacterium]|nr:hydroxyacylglutathione hydrolase [Deltaproteobacteria bacterium]
MHTVTQPTPPIEACGGALRIHRIAAASDNLVWIAVCVETGAAAVIDGPSAAEALAACEAEEITLSAVWNTHTHDDHIGINRDLQRLGRLEGLEVIGPALVADAVPGLTCGVDEGDEVRLGALTAQVLRTEGHVDGHVSYLLGDALFCGDTLFTGGCGYLFDGPPDKMYRSLMRLAELPGETLVCCAHEYTQDNLRFAWSVEPDNPALAQRIRAVWAIRSAGGCVVPSTLEEERATNPFLRPGSPSLIQRVAAASAQLGPAPTPSEVFAATRALKDTGAHQALADSSLPLADSSLPLADSSLPLAGL